jgi:CRP-like cAMP-binding protein
MTDKNRILAALSADDYIRVLPELEPVHLKPDQILTVPGEPMRYVYFPRDAVLCLRVPMEDGRSLAGASVGNEGLVGLSVYLADGAATDELTCDIGGMAARMESASFRDVVADCPPLQVLLQRYTLALMHQLARTAGCNRVHSVRERCARWLLMTHDRAGASSFSLTHDALAVLLGVRRASVSEAAESLQAEHLISYRRGRMTISDRAGLEAAACEDYRITQDVYSKLYGCNTDRPVVPQVVVAASVARQFSRHAAPTVRQNPRLGGRPHLPRGLAGSGEARP